MGFILPGTERISCEPRRESFVVHTLHAGPHPEFLYMELPDLIYALTEMTAHLNEKNRKVDYVFNAKIVHDPHSTIDEVTLQTFYRRPRYEFTDGYVA